jgi:MerR family transcriptional regulator, light-induced transcriptional regulator
VDDATSSAISEALYSDYLQALLAGRSSACGDVVLRLLKDAIDVRDLYTGLFQPSLYRVGELWESGQISVATEHLATSITERLMSLDYPAIFSREHSDHKAVVSCAANEYHQIGGRMVADVFELNRWHGYFLGANTPVQDLVRIIEEREPEVVALSVSVYFNMPSVARAIDAVRSVHPTIPILVGGQAFRWGDGGLSSTYPDVQPMTSLADLERFIGTREGS